MDRARLVQHLRGQAQFIRLEIVLELVDGHGGCVGQGVQNRGQVAGVYLVQRCPVFADLMAEFVRNFCQARAESLL